MIELLKQKITISTFWKIVVFVFLVGGAYTGIQIGLLSHEKRITKIENCVEDHKEKLARIDEQYKFIKEGIESINKKLDN